jgi:hypothetical protein
VPTPAIEKINRARDLPQIKQAPIQWGGGFMVIPHPVEVVNIMKSVPYGKTITIDVIRNRLAISHNVDIACPITTGLFISIAAKSYAEGDDWVPYWRTLKRNWELNAKFPGGVEDHRDKLVSEGHIIRENGRRMFVSSPQ